MSLGLRFVKLALAIVAVAFAMVGVARATSVDTDKTDIWWNPNESGWGVNMIQTDSFIFAAMYVYGPDGTPTWYTGELQRVAGGSHAYAGPLYASTGPFFGAATFSPDKVKARQVGSMTFTGLTVWTGTLHYTVDGITVDKLIERQPLTLDYYHGTYNIQATMTSSNCKDTAFNGVFTSPGEATITQDGQSMSVKLTGVLGDGTCTIPTTMYRQLGRMGRLEGPYSCDWGETGTAALFEMNNAPYIFSARMTLDSPNFGCHSEGELVGLTPR